ncbi:hypothetical protein RhiirA4_424280 [Rhizophagus irregularis]|uniref:Uncharacterized protein n=1 Tax=Rhizophagus irregularis TaxID=588596 RepID=A0A2I1GWW0_9GLOM|nr:hypothetical protein RhiirA4_424280 [Rhizophagus irregularis]
MASIENSTLLPKYYTIILHNIKESEVTSNIEGFEESGTRKFEGSGAEEFERSSIEEFRGSDTKESKGCKLYGIMGEEGISLLELVVILLLGIGLLELGILGIELSK